MTQCRGMRTRARAASAVILLVGIIALFDRTPNVSAHQALGTIYTSPTYGYTVTWQLPWYLVDDETDAAGFDLLRIADSRSEAQFVGGVFGYVDSAAALQGAAHQLEDDTSYANVRRVDDPQCSARGTERSIASGCYRADISYRDSSQGAIGIFIKVWVLGDGVTLIMRAYTEESILLGYVPHWNRFGVYEQGTEAQLPPSGCATEVHLEIRFCFDPTLGERDRSDIVEGVLFSQRDIETIAGDSPIGVVNVTGLNGITPAGVEIVATAYEDAIAVYAGSQHWQVAAPIERIVTLIHEYFHVYQNAMVASSLATIPSWFTEGSAESFAIMVATQIGVTDQSEFDTYGLYQLTHSPVSGRLEDLGTHGAMSTEAYPLAYWAVQYLLGTRGVSVVALGEVYQEVRAGSSFGAAFTSVFGLSLEQFYTEFEAWRLVSPLVYAPDDDFYPMAGPAPGSVVEWVASGATVEWTKYPATVHLGEQMVFVAQTGALVNCELTVTFPGRSPGVTRVTRSNGQGEVFRLVSVPDDGETGAGRVYATCGGMPKSSVFGVKANVLAKDAVEAPRIGIGVLWMDQR